MFIHFRYANCTGEFDMDDLPYIVRTIERLATGKMHRTLKAARRVEDELASKIKFESSIQGLAAIHHATWLPGYSTHDASCRGVYVIDIAAPSVRDYMSSVAGTGTSMSLFAKRTARFTAVWEAYYNSDGNLKSGVVPHTFCIINNSSENGEQLEWGE